MSDIEFRQHTKDCIRVEKSGFLILGHIVQYEYYLFEPCDNITLTCKDLTTIANKLSELNISPSPTPYVPQPGDFVRITTDGPNTGTYYNAETGIIQKDGTTKINDGAIDLYFAIPSEHLELITR